MNNNLAKNRFFSRSIQLDLILDKMSIKQRLLSCLRETIVVYRQETYIPSDIDKILKSLSDKVILLNDQTFSSLVYCSAITFPLANIHNLPSLQVAQELVGLLANNFPKLVNANKDKLQFTIKVIKAGLIEFVICDRSIGFWLEKVLRRLGNTEIINPKSLFNKGLSIALAHASWVNSETEEWRKYNLVPLQYVNNRCVSLLLLGKREGLISLKEHNFSSQILQIMNSNSFQYYCDDCISYRYEATEINLLHQLSLVIDYFNVSFGENQLLENELKVAWQLLFNLANACLEFIAACRIFGSVAQQQRDLAIARLGLINIVQFYLEYYTQIL